MIRPIRLLPAFLSVGSWTMLCRVLGLARDILMAAFLGTGPVAQAFLIAFTLPNMFRRFFAEGAFNLAFVPMFAKKVEAGEDAESFARDALSGLGFVLLVFTVVGQIAMPWLVSPWPAASPATSASRSRSSTAASPSPTSSSSR